MLDQNSRDPALDEALELFFYGFRAFTALPDQVLAERGLQRVHHRALYFVGRHPGLSVNALLGILGVSKQALNAPLRQLIERGLIAVEVGQHDRRVRELTLTPAGAELEAALSAAQHALMGKVFAEVGPEAEGQWKRVMRALAAR
ncbi:MarR family winged helix-turn-helix transcriptional regulator [Rivihabitans pingtungensis]|jgi:DNA-binding MarR family transcriptional regulator|uniref:MarR family winged helix-turn-helix transcriptional regulator n=1 Tax=Rivihabitans pingtungensis TaxID=1054498 RepID=UPI0023F27AFA|nr:helix-turn-helix domain-containing protein [Rivihabitans pingtungensis]HNX72207.1 helix-turn-helix domain-containing protein [Rivihabitans pingtungensis]